MNIIAHRGLRNEFPENTVDSISEALKLPGIYGVEFDVELTRDGCGVVLHQETVVPDKDLHCIVLADRNIESRDWVRGKSAQEVSAMDAGSWMESQVAHLKVPLLSEVLSLSWGDVVAYVELKDATLS